VGATVSWISTTPVKALALAQLTEVELLERGPRGDRCFFLVDTSNRLVNNKGTRGPLQLIHATYEEAAARLTLRFPDGTTVDGDTVAGDELTTNFHRRPRAARRVAGPWDEALSETVGESLRLVAADVGADRGRGGAATLLGEGSLGAIAGVLAVDRVDCRRFRMNFGIDGIEAHEEDGWIGRRIQVGEAVVVPQGNVGRCAITTQNPDTGQVDLDTLQALAAYRGEVETTEPLPLGIHAAVAQPGRVRLGDAILPL
jgi:MOSC domain-containing protein